LKKENEGMDYDGLLTLVKSRRSCRRFKPDPVPDELLTKILEVGRWAPSGANSQPWEFVVVKETETREKIARFVKDLISIYYRFEHTRDPALRFPSITKPVDRIGYEDAPVYIIPCGDRRTQAAYPLYTAVEIADSILESSMANAFLYMHLAATALGLGAQWVSAVRMWYVQQLVRDLLGIPDYFMVYDMLVLGYPVSDAKPRMVRGMAEMVHHERFDVDRIRTDEQVEEFIAALRKGRTYSEMGSKRSSIKE
jgi:nitroreductase